MCTNILSRDKTGLCVSLQETEYFDWMVELLEWREYQLID